MIDLSRNESPYAVSARMREKIAACIVEMHRYPVMIAEQARAAAAARFGVAKDNLVLTRGIDDAVDRLILGYRDNRFFVVTPGFDGFVERLRANGVPYASLVLDGDFRLPDSEIERLGSESFVLVASPNNPTGLRFSEPALAAVAARCHGMLVDQTYEDFAAPPAPLLPKRRHFYRFRSFSKGFALAGLRLGALFGTAADISAIDCLGQYCPIDTIASGAILCATAGSEFQENVEAIVRLRSELAHDLRDNGFNLLTCEANFLLLQTGRPAEVVAYLETCGILVKDTAPMGLPGYVRISAGTREDHAALVRALIAFRESPGDADMIKHQCLLPSSVREQH